MKRKTSAAVVISIILGIAMIWFVGRFVYMILCISCTTSPIKTYEYSGTMDQFQAGLTEFIRANPNMHVDVSQRDSSDNMSARDMIVEMENKTETIRFSLTVYKFNETTDVDLDAVFDETHNRGGTNTDDATVKELFGLFTNDFLVRLRRDQCVVLKPNFFNF